MGRSVPSRTRHHINPRGSPATLSEDPIILPPVSSSSRHLLLVSLPLLSLCLSLCPRQNQEPAPVEIRGNGHPLPFSAPRPFKRHYLPSGFWTPNAFGVADGIGSWSRRGIDAGEIRRLSYSGAIGTLLQETLKTALAGTTARGRRRRASSAMSFTVQLALGDVVVAATDGLFDKEIVALVTKERAERLLRTASDIAHALEAAPVAAFSGSKDTPFAAACRAEGLPWTGGEPDDVTVVVLTVRTSKNALATFCSPNVHHHRS
ncbi:unnamed protein product [Spirodela intermedia]|uniref:Protein phosphatase n=1 Tax=Spirodela intermedia TaxID=51605 RepID=A0A7I8IIX1_SPIIN|nr:unnamed protein product [Spirodela intermedia]CAA6657299.1 unnamed protein product [Spirodela intermedia]